MLCHHIVKCPLVLSVIEYASLTPSVRNKWNHILVYIKLYLVFLQWATHRIQRASRAEEILKHSASNGEFTHLQSQTHLDPGV